MGTRRSGGSSGVFRSTRRGARYVGTLKRQLDENAAAKVAVNTAVSYAAASNPAVGSVVAAYKVGKFAGSVGTAYSKTMRRTGSKERARKAALHAAEKGIKKEIKGATIDAAVNRVLPATGDKATTNLARALAKSVAKEVFSA